MRALSESETAPRGGPDPGARLACGSCTGPRERPVQPRLSHRMSRCLRMTRPSRGWFTRSNRRTGRRVLTADAGLGKSTVLRRAFDEARDPRRRFALVSCPRERDAAHGNAGGTSGRTRRPRTEPAGFLAGARTGRPNGIDPGNTHRHRNRRLRACPRPRSPRHRIGREPGAGRKPE